MCVCVCGERGSVRDLGDLPQRGRAGSRGQSPLKLTSKGGQFADRALLVWCCLLCDSWLLFSLYVKCVVAVLLLLWWCIWRSLSFCNVNYLNTRYRKEVTSDSWSTLLLYSFGWTWAKMCLPSSWHRRHLKSVDTAGCTVCPKISEPLNILQQQPQICSDLNKILHARWHLLQTLLHSFI